MREKLFPNITSPQIDDYCKAWSSLPNNYLQELDKLSQETHDPKMISGAHLGRLLSMISKMVRPSRILELGTFTGYGTLCLAEGLQDDGEIHTIEKKPEMKGFADSIFAKAGIDDQVVQYIGDAAEIISDIDEEFDLVFIDAAKRQYIKYFDLIIPKMKSGGIIIADNILWKGKVVSEDNDKLGQGLDAFNRYIHQNQYVENVIIPVDDGINLIRKL